MKGVFVPVAFLVLGFYSCQKPNKPVPDIETHFSNSFKIQIRSNSGSSATQIVDVTKSEQYKDFKNNVGKFEIDKITYLIKNYNAPDDMSFVGTLFCCNEEETECYPVGSTRLVNPSGLAAEGLENELIPVIENMDKIISWLDSPGRFALKTGYSLVNADGTQYLIDDSNIGTNFVMVVYLYVTVKLKS